MSSTNRGTQRNKDDYYITPEFIIKNFANWARYNLSHFIWPVRHDIKVFDPCAGGSLEYPIMPYPVYFGKELLDYRLFWRTNDIRTDASAELCGNFLRPDYDKYRNRFDIVISNPPYNQAIEFIHRGLEMVRQGGYVIYLLRLNFFGTQSRAEFFKYHMPKYTVVSSKRPSFTKRGTDSTEYAHFVWQKHSSPDYSQIYVR